MRRKYNEMLQLRGLSSRASSAMQRGAEPEAH